MVRPLPLSATQRTLLSGWARLLKTALNAAVVGAVLAAYLAHEEHASRRAETRAQAVALHDQETQATERAFYEALKGGDARAVACGRIAYTSQAIAGELTDRAMQLCSAALGAQPWRMQ